MIIAFSAPVLSHAAGSVALAWNTVTEPNIIGYRLYHGTASGTYDEVVDVGNATTTEVSDLVVGTTYYFAVTAYNASGMESGLSNEAAFTVPSSVPSAPTSPTSLATDDQVTLTAVKPITIDVLANDHSNGGALAITAVTQPANGIATLRSDGTILYSPGKTFKGEDAFTYSVSDGQGGSGTATVTIIAPFLLAKGSFHGLITGSSTDSNENGFLQLTLLPSGQFTGRIRLGALNLPIRGTFNSAGDATVSIAARGNQPGLSIVLALDALTGQVTGTVSSSAGFTSSISSKLASFSQANPAPQAGAYTIIFPPDTETPTAGSAPQGYGFGRLVVTKRGQATFSGQLGDGTKLAVSVPIGNDGSLPFFASLYSGKGSIAGTVAFEITSTPGSESDLNGTLEWIRPSSKTVSSSTPFPAGFVTSVTMVGSTFVAPTQHRSILALPGSPANVTVTLSNGNLPAPISKSATLTANSSLIVQNPGTDKLRITLTPGTGIFSGTFFNVASNRTQALRGVVFQKQSIAAGLSLGTTGSSAVLVTQGP